MDRPLLKWIGGKTKIIDALISSFPRQINDYYEPFLGGGSVLLAVLQSGIKITGAIKVSDLNPHLMNFFKAVRDEPRHLSHELRQLVDDPMHETPEPYYYHLRERFNSAPTPALFLVLNRTCFRGLYRESKRGFNSPYGFYKNPLFPTLEQILKVSRLIQRVDFTCQSFEQSLACVKKGDFAYCDPPYSPLSRTASFVSYVAVGFAEHEKLFSICKGLPSPFVMSNSDADLVLESFPEDFYHIQKIPCKRSLKPGAKGLQINEVIISRIVANG